MAGLAKHKNSLFAMDISTDELWDQALVLGRSPKMNRTYFDTLAAGQDTVITDEKWREWLCWWIVDALHLRNLL